MEQTKDIWRLWQCPTCRSEMKINYVASEEDYNRFKDCIPTCSGELTFIKDLKEGDKV